MKAAIIGANSYIARNMLKINFEKKYADVLLFDRAEEHMDGYENYKRLDFEVPEAVQAAISDVDLIYFFTGKTGTLQGFDNPKMFLDVNENKLFDLLNACCKQRTKAKIIFPSTRLVYKGDIQSLTEAADKAFLTPYAIQKYACEQYLKMYNNLFGINYCVLRICVPYASLVQPVASYGTLDFFLKQAKEDGLVSVYGDGNQRRTFTHIEDLCNILWLAGLEPNCANDVYNVGGEQYSIRGVAEKIATRFGARVNYVSWPENVQKLESGDTVFNSLKLDTLLGYKYAMNFDKWLEKELI